MPETAEAAATMTDLDAIRRVIALYGQLLDDRRFEAWGDLFTQDAVFGSIPGGHLPGGKAVGLFEGREAIVGAIARVQQDLSAQWPVVHFGGNAVIDVAGYTAKAWWDFLVMYLKPGGIEIAHAGRYYADFRREGGCWRFSRRISVRPGHALPADVCPTPDR